MAPRTTRPGLRALDPTTPIGHTSWGPIWPAAGGRASSRGMDFLVGDDSGDDPDFDDEDDADEDDDDGPDDDEDVRAEHQREQDRRDAARGWQRPRRGERQRDDADEGEEGEDDDRRGQRRRGRRGSAEDTDEWTPPTREAWEKVTEATARNNSELRKRRFLGKPLENLGITSEETLREKLIGWGIDPDSGERLDGADHEDGDAGFFDSGAQDGDQRDDRQRQPSRAELLAERRRHEERGAQRAEARMKPGMVLYAAEAELRAQGFTGKDLGLAIRLIDLDKIEVEFGDDGWPEMFGLVEQVGKIKEGVPEWFRQPRAARERDDEREEPRQRRTNGRRVGGARAVDGGDRPRGDGRTQTWLQRADAQMMGRGRR